MRLASFQRALEHRIGALLDGQLIDLNRAEAARHEALEDAIPQATADASVPSEMAAFLARGRDAMHAAELAVDFARDLDPAIALRELLIVDPATVTLLPPVPNPPKIICVARNYAEHAREAGLKVSDIPIVFSRFSETLVASGGAVVCPSVSDQLDWEGELALIIGTSGRHIARTDAIGHIAGYSIFNDITVRDFQFRVSQYTSGKNFPASGPFGPYLVTANEIEDPHNLNITTEVNGVVKQAANTGSMIFDLATIIADISQWIELSPGDVIATGTPAGVGFKREPPEFLRPGDHVSVSIDGLGTLSNPVVAEGMTSA